MSNSYIFICTGILESGDSVSFSFFFTGTFFQEAVVCLFPAAVALRAAVGWPVALPCPLHGAAGASRRACTPGRPLIPGSVH